MQKSQVWLLAAAGVAGFFLLQSRRDAASEGFADIMRAGKKIKSATAKNRKTGEVIDTVGRVLSEIGKGLPDEEQTSGAL